MVADGAGQGAQPEHQAVRAGLGRARLGRQHLLDHLHHQLPGQLAELRDLARADHQLPRRLERTRLQHRLVRAAAVHAERRRLLGGADRGGRQRLVDRHRHRRQPDLRQRRLHHRRALPVHRRRRRQRRHLPGQRHRRGHRQAAVGQRERVAGPQRRRGRAHPVHRPRVHRRGADRVHQLAADRVDLPGSALRRRRADARQPALVGRLQRRREPVGHRPGHPVHAAGLAVPQRGLRVPGRHRVQRQLRHAQVHRRHRLLHHHRDHDRDRGADGERRRVGRAVDRRPCTCGRPT